MSDPGLSLAELEEWRNQLIFNLRNYGHMEGRFYRELLTDVLKQVNGWIAAYQLLGSGI